MQNKTNKILQIILLKKQIKQFLKKIDNKRDL